MSAPTLRSVALGRLFGTPAALEDLPQEDFLALVRRHAVGDWGDLDPEDAEANDRAFDSRDGSRLHSSYDRPDGKESIWIITDDPFSDLPTTTVLLPSDY